MSRFNVFSMFVRTGSFPANYVTQNRQKLSPNRFSAINPPNSSSVSNRNLSSKMPGETCVMKYVKLSVKAHEPTRGSEYAAGFDLKSAYDYIVPAHGKELVKTDIQVKIPDGCYGRIAPRSGLAWKNFIDIGAGVIDADYRGNIGIVIFNHGNNDFEIKEGDRIAQLICEKIAYPSLEEVESLDYTLRGIGGFGSTGSN